jgi:hypothetical protein
MMASFAAVINPVAAAAGNKDRICLRSCKYVTVDAVCDTFFPSFFFISSVG